MHERRKQAQVIAEQAAAKKADAEKVNKQLSEKTLAASENMAKTSAPSAKTHAGQPTRKVEITYAKDFLIAPDETTVKLMVKERVSNEKANNEAKLNHLPTPTTGNDTLMWMACSGTARERVPFLVMIMPTLFEKNKGLSELLNNKNNTIVIDKVEFKNKDKKHLLAPRIEFHVRDNRTGSETHYQCEFIKTNVALSENPAFHNKKGTSSPTRK